MEKSIKGTDNIGKTVLRNLNFNPEAAWIWRILSKPCQTNFTFYCGRWCLHKRQTVLIIRVFVSVHLVF